MNVCHSLGKTEEEIAHWSVDDVLRWHAFFKLKNDIADKASKRGARNPSPPNKKFNQVIIE